MAVKYDPEVEAVANAAWGTVEKGKAPIGTAPASRQPTIAEQIYKHLIPNRHNDERKPRR
jgi:hypothetical protein